MTGSPKLKFAELREYESRNGRRYFAGYLGKVKLLMFEDRSAELTGSELARWTLYAEQAEPWSPPRDVLTPLRPRAGEDDRARARAGRCGPHARRRPQ